VAYNGSGRDSRRRTGNKRKIGRRAKKLSESWTAARAQKIREIAAEEPVLLAFGAKPLTLHSLRDHLQNGGRDEEGPTGNGKGAGGFGREVVVADGSLSAARKEAVKEKLGLGGSTQTTIGRDGEGKEGLIALCSDAMSEGLNLQRASSVVLLDTPSVIRIAEQRVGRIDRMDSPHDEIDVWWPEDSRPFQSARRDLLIERYNLNERLMGNNIDLPDSIGGEKDLFSEEARQRASTTALIEQYEEHQREGPERRLDDAFRPAREEGTDSPMIFVFLLKRSADQLDDAIATERAAKATIDVRGRTTTQECEEARQAMITRREQATQRKEAALEEIIEGARVFLAGGQEYVADDVSEAVENAALNALERLYPKFETADDSRWHRVLRRARDGDADALKAIDFWDNPEEHPVCEAVLEAVSSSSTGKEVRKTLTTAPHGWPQDAVDAALVLLTLTNHVRAKNNGEAVEATDLTQRTIGKTRFRAETVMLSRKQILEVRGLLQQMTDDVTGNEQEKVPEFLERVRQLAGRFSGPPPLPKKPNLDYVEEVARQSGNEQLDTLHEHKERFLEETGDWQSMANRKNRREAKWSQLQTALRHGRGLDGMEEIREEADAIKRQRSLLHPTDPVQPLLDRATDLLRESLQSVYDAYESAYRE